ncbi:hypothetical protein [Mycolicibacterium helvum]|uniref:Uncharacterized protein n=1 Tax=Mycolicibacterium helvum TaxID=1534349 RepID=A0A7I7TG54_9MYCO|nr:hypothetical protein [Mycolicibacterium helvum]BBY67355.1 hypothetical protein MHEL_55980 [Mycolicibacterium helvum]
MSEGTAAELARLRQIEAEEWAALDNLKAECVARVADGMAAEVDAYAKKIANAHPEQAKALGKEGVSALRRELAEVTAELADQLRGAVDEIEWPEPKQYGKLDSSAVHSALFKFLYGARVDRLTRVLKAHGFPFEPTAGVLPQDLYDRSSFGDLAEALQNIGRIQQEVAQAKIVDDRDTVDSLWEEQ